MRRGGATRRALGAVVLAALTATACVGPSRTLGDYEEKAANAAEATISTVETARMVVAALLEGKATMRYTSLVLSESEVDTGSIATGFESVQPPGAEADTIRSELSTVLNDATTVLGELRIAAYRGDRAGLAEKARRLPEVRVRLEPFLRLAPT